MEKEITISITPTQKLVLIIILLAAISEMPDTQREEKALLKDLLSRIQT